MLDIKHQAKREKNYFFRVRNVKFEKDRRVDKLVIKSRIIQKIDLIHLYLKALKYVNRIYGQSSSKHMTANVSLYF